MGRKTHSTKSWNRRQSQGSTSSTSDHADILHTLRTDFITPVTLSKPYSKTGIKHSNSSTGNNTCTNTPPPDTVKIHQRSLPGAVSMASAFKQTGKETSIFPRNLQWLCFLVTLLFRLWYVSTPENWWILHPDEVFQTVEVAHSETFGYGFRPYEYMPPPGSDVTNETISTAQAQEIQRGMYSLRSFLMIRVISYVMWVATLSGVNASPFLVAKVFHAAISSSLQLAVFSFTFALYMSRDVAMLAAIFVSSSVSLNVFGTHSLINSFLSPLIFISLVPFIQICKSSVITSSKDFVDKDNVERASNAIGVNGEELIESSNIHTRTKNINGLHLNMLPTNGLKTVTKYSYFFGSYLCNSKTVDVNANISATNKVHNGLCANGKNGQYVLGQNGRYSVVCENGHYPNGQNGHLGNATRHIYPSKTSTLTHGYHQREAKREHKMHTDIKHVKDYILNNGLQIYHYAMGLCLALCVYVRPDSLMLIIFFCLPMCIFSKRVMATLMPYTFGIVTGFLIGGFIDYVTYGAWFISPVQWFRFNVLKKLSGTIYGKATWDFYLIKLYNNEPLILVLLLTVIIDAICSYLDHRHTRVGPRSKHGHRAWNQTTFVFICLLFSYSLNGHKELRFLHNGMILMYISFARAIAHLYQLYEKVSSNQNNRQYYMCFVYIFIAMFVSSHHYEFINTTGDAISKWTYGGQAESQEVNICLDFIRRQHDVTGVFMDRHLYTSGGYSALHKDVPIIALNKHEFIEYDMQSRFTDQTYSIDGTLTHVSVLGRISEFISVYHTDYLLKYLLVKKSYNYLVIRNDREFIDIGYHEVFRINNMKVLKRSLGIENEAALKKIADGIPIGRNATILEYEGDWLKHFGLYRKAEQRLVLSNRLDPKRLGPFLVLLDMYKSLGNHDDYKQVMKACKEVHVNKLCRLPYVPLQLHENYYRQVNKE